MLFTSFTDDARISEKVAVILRSLTNQFAIHYHNDRITRRKMCGTKKGGSHDNATTTPNFTAIPSLERGALWAAPRKVKHPPLQNSLFPTLTPRATTRGLNA
jgi:hypothetical protein